MIYISASTLQGTHVNLTIRSSFPVFSITSGLTFGVIYVRSASDDHLPQVPGDLQSHKRHCEARGRASVWHYAESHAVCLAQRLPGVGG